jgi:hypothetical protein
MSSLPTWAAWVIVAACPLLGPVIAFLVVLPIAALDRWISRAKGGSGPSAARAGPYRTVCLGCAGIVAGDNSDRNGS